MTKITVPPDSGTIFIRGAENGDIRIGPGEGYDGPLDEEIVVARPPVSGAALVWEPITDTSQATVVERARIDASRGWLVRTWMPKWEQGGQNRTDELVSVVFVPDDNEMWGK